MATINADSIMDKVYAYERSDKGQKRMQQTLSKYVKSNVEKTKAGSKVLTYRKMEEAGRKLVEMITQSANGCGLPDSVAAHFDSLKCGKPIRQSDGSYLMEISFTDDLTRASLQPEDYGGVTNIVAIFNNGYPKDRSRSEAISHVSGWWHDKNTTALGYRPGLFFMQSAVNDFNMNYGRGFDIYAEVAAIYDSE